MKCVILAAILSRSIVEGSNVVPRRLRRTVQKVDVLIPSSATIKDFDDYFWSETDMFSRGLQGSSFSLSMSMSLLPDPPTTSSPVSTSPGTTQAPVAAPTPPTPGPPVSPAEPGTAVPTTSPSLTPPVAAPTGISTTSPSIGAPIVVPAVPPSPLPTIETSSGPPISAPIPTGGAQTEFPSVAPTTSSTTGTSTSPTTAITSSPTSSPVGTTSESPSSPPSVTSTGDSLLDCEFASEEERKEAIRSELIESGVSIGASNTNQGKALDWIATDDARQLCPSDESLLQRYVLAVLYYSTDGDSWDSCSREATSCVLGESARSNFLSADSECVWGGIKCSSQGSLRDVELDNNNLRGVIPSELGAVSSIRVLGFSENEIGGGIPASLANIDPFLVLRVDKNNLTGPIPSGLSAALVRLNVADNSLSGEIPSLGPALRVLQLQNNNLSGTIPAALGDAKEMTIARFHGNLFTGEMPGEICSLIENERLEKLTADCPDVQCGCCTNSECEG